MRSSRAYRYSILRNLRRMNRSTRRKVITLALVLLPVCTGSAIATAADDECTAARPTPITNAASVRVSDYRAVHTDARTLEETFVLDKEQAVRIVHGGCAHYGFDYVFEMNEPPSTPTARLVSALALTELLGEVANAGLGSAMEAVRRVAETESWDGKEPIESIPGYECVEVTLVRRDPRPAELHISIDIAL